MPSPEIRPVTSQSALNRVHGMPFRWSLNPYRGCVHDCVYCYARATHAYFDLGVGSSFARVIFAKMNLASVLRREINRPGWQFESIAIGTATDPYQPAEGTYRITRACLEVLADAGHPCTITTKGTLLVRDLDLMTELSRSTEFGVYVSLATLDLDLWRRLEPGTAPPASRLRALAKLRAAGISASVLVMPIVPGLTDRPDQLASLIRAAADHGALGAWPAVLRLAPGVKEWFFDFLRRDFPGLVESYRRGYATGSDSPGFYRSKIDDRVATTKETIRFNVPARPTPPARKGRQLLMFP